MKTKYCVIWIGVLCVGATWAGSQTATIVSEQPTELGPHHTLWQTVRRGVTSSGKTYFRTNSYVALETGMHYWEDGQWKDSKEEIEILNGAAVAQKGQHKVIFAANPNTLWRSAKLSRVCSDKLSQRLEAEGAASSFQGVEFSE
jgi:hypothetical protein